MDGLFYNLVFISTGVNSMLRNYIYFLLAYAIKPRSCGDSDLLMHSIFLLILHDFFLHCCNINYIRSIRKILIKILRWNSDYYEFLSINVIEHSFTGQLNNRGCRSHPFHIFILHVNQTSWTKGLLHQCDPT